MDFFCCPRCLAVSWSPDDVAAGYCGSCCDVTRIEGLSVRLYWTAGEWECRPCGIALTVPWGGSWPPPACGRCERAADRRLHPEVTVDAARYTGRSRAEAEMFLGLRTAGLQLRALRGEHPLRSLAEGGAAWYERVRELANMQRWQDLTMTASATMTPAEMAEFYRRSAGWSLDDLPVSAAGTISSEEVPEGPLGALTPAEIDRLLARNQTVMEVLIVNHSASAEAYLAEYPWTDPASWSPGYTEL